MRRRTVLAGLAAAGAATAIGGTDLGIAPARAATGEGEAAEPLPGAAGRGLYWGINTNIKFNRDDDAYRRRIIALTRELNIGYVREAAFAVGGRSVDEPFDWTWLDRALADLERAGLGCMLALRIEDCVNPDGWGPRWEANVRARVAAIGRRYGQRILWYSPWNEPDLEGAPAGAVLRAQKIVWEELKSADPRLAVQSAPLSTPRGSGDMMVRLCEAGITRWCDFLGCHLHNGVHDDSRNSLKHAWTAQQRAAAVFGHPIRPVSLSENGYRWTMLDHPRPHALKAHWAMLDLVQVKRYGCAQAIVYSLASSRARGGSFNLVDDTADLARWQPEFDAYARSFHADPWRLERGIDGGFESGQADATGGWVVHYDPLTTGGDPGPFREWDRVSFPVGDGVARSGRGCCRMRAGGPNRVRRLVEGLTPGRPYTLRAWVRLDGGAGATLAAMGHNRLNGLDDRTVATREAGRWVELATTFTPSQPWVVVGLEHDGRGSACWDDVTLS